jgi:LysM domain
MSRKLRGAGALTALAAVLVGVPYLLVEFVGRPWPHPMPSAGEIVHSIDVGSIGDGVVIKALALVMWVTWARLVGSIIVEVVARRSGRRTPRIAVLGSTQEWAATLMSAVLLLVGGASSGVAAAAEPSIPRPIAIELLRDLDAPVNTLDDTFRGHRVDAPAAARVADASGGSSAPSAHIVRRNDSFWSIAAEHLGDGSRWREILDLNRGREVAAGVMFDGTPQHLLPGWQLLLPASGVASPSPATASETTVIVRPGDTLTSLATRELGHAEEWPRLWTANEGRAFGERTFNDPNLIVPGWELVIPVDVQPPTVGATAETDVAEAGAATTMAAAPTTVAIAPTTIAAAPTTVAMAPTTIAAAPTTVAAAPTTIVASPTMIEQVRHGAVADENADEHRGTALPTGLGSAVLVASGVIGAVTIKRRRTLRSAGIRTRLIEPSPDAVRTETILRRLGEGEQIARLDVALRAAASELVVTSSGIGIVGAQTTVDGRIDLLLSGVTAAAPTPWRHLDDRTWRLEASVPLTTLADAARSASQPCPALVHLGTTTSKIGFEATDVFVDLEAIGLLVIDARERDAASVLRAIAAALAVSPLAETAHLITCGLDGDYLDHPSTHDAESLDVALDLAAGMIGTTAATASASLSTFTLRARQQGGEAWEPAIVVAANGGEDRLVDADLLNLSLGGGRGVGVAVDRVVPGARWRIEQGEHAWILHPLGIEFTPVGLTSADVSCVRHLLDEADHPPVVDDVANLEFPSPDASASLSFAETEWPLMVRLLGSVDVVDRDGSTVEFERSKALELVVWLSQHRDRSTRSGARTSLWEANVRDATFANVVSDARRALARLVPAIDGEEWIGRTLTEQLPLHPRIITDVEVLQARLAHARSQAPPDAIATLRPGLELVRDIPFAGTSYLWPDAEGITSHMTLLVTAAASSLASHYLAVGDVEGVFWATGQGLKVLAGHEELIALRMRAHGSQGDIAGVRHVWAEYERALHADTWSDGEPAPKLVALRRELLAPALIRA